MILSGRLSSKLLLCSGIVLLVVPILAEVPESTPNVEVIADLISTPRVDAFSLIRMKPTAMWSKVIEMIEAGSATSESVWRSTARPGERDVTESVEEIRYPTTFRGSSNSEKEKALRAKNADLPREMVKALEAHLTPVDFQSRNCGLYLEIVSRLRSDGRIDLEITPTLTKLDRFEAYPLGAKKEMWHADQPVFQMLRVSSKVIARLGEPSLLAISVDPGKGGVPSDRSMLLFVTARMVSESNKSP